MTDTITSKAFELFRDRPPVGILMSGVGTNARALLASEAFRDYYDVRLIATDNSLSSAETVSKEHALPYFLHDSAELNAKLSREAYFESISNVLDEYDVKALVYAGFMKIVTPRFAKKYPGVNVHPADLTIIGADELPKYRGMKALEAMASDLGYVKSTVHIVDNPVDSGTPIAISKRVESYPGESSQSLHSRLKKCEHEIFPQTLVRMANGTLMQDDIPFDFSYESRSSS